MSTERTTHSPTGVGSSSDEVEEEFVAFEKKKSHIYEKKNKKPHPMLVTECFVPWLQFEKIDDSIPPLVRLHNEILSFCEYCAPTALELEQRDLAFKEVSNAILELYPEAKIAVFGSQMTKILTPTSDLDVAMLNIKDECMEKDPLAPLFSVAENLTKKRIVSYIEVLSNAKVPIVKFDHYPSGISFDICMNNTSGIDSGKLIRDYVKIYPQLRPLAITLKIYLSQRKLNETYTGGIGSFALCNMLISFLQMRQRIENHTKVKQSWNLGSLLLDFFRFYSTQLNMYHTGISIRNGGRYFPKRSPVEAAAVGIGDPEAATAALLENNDKKKGGIKSNKGGDWVNPARLNLLSLENPVSTDIDLGRNSYMMNKVRRAFEHAYQVLTTSLTEYATDSDDGYFGFLSFVVRPDDEVLVSRGDVLLAEGQSDVQGEESVLLKQIKTNKFSRVGGSSKSIKEYQPGVAAFARSNYHALIDDEEECLNDLNIMSGDRVAVDPTPISENIEDSGKKKKKKRKKRNSLESGLTLSSASSSPLPLPSDNVVDLSVDLIEEAIYNEKEPGVYVQHPIELEASALIDMVDDDDANSEDDMKRGEKPSRKRKRLNTSRNVNMNVNAEVEESESDDEIDMNSQFVASSLSVSALTDNAASSYAYKL